MQKINIFHILFASSPKTGPTYKPIRHQLGSRRTSTRKTREMHFALWTPRNCSYARRALISAVDIVNGNSVMGCWFKDAIKQSGGPRRS